VANARRIFNSNTKINDGGVELLFHSDIAEAFDKYYKNYWRINLVSVPNASGGICMGMMIGIKIDLMMVSVSQRLKLLYLIL